MTRAVVRLDAPDGVRYAADAFDTNVGRPLPVRVDGIDVDQALVVAVEVAPDGRCVTLTLDLPGLELAPRGSVETP